MILPYLWRHGFINGSPPVQKLRVSRVVILMCEKKDKTPTYQISFSDDGSFTTLLSDGDRPVFAPEYAVKAPLDAIAEPISYTFDLLLEIVVPEPLRASRKA